jgi:hypothetical protein
VWVELVGDGEAGAARVTIEYQEADPAWAACLAGPYPLDAAVVKADWRRAELGFTVPRFDTSAASLAAMTASPAPRGPRSATTTQAPTASTPRSCPTATATAWPGCTS